MQSLSSLSRALFRIVFRSGSPQRIQYSDRLLIVSVLSFGVLLVASQVFFYAATIVETGLILFTSMTGIYIATALLTRKASRMRIRTSLLAGFLLLAAAQAILLLIAPFADMISGLRPTVSLVLGIITLMGVTNILRYALSSSLSLAALYAVACAAGLGIFYVAMRWLLQIVFS